MKLSAIAKKVAYKTLSSVDIVKHGSNQHEFNGVKALKVMFGTERVEDNIRCVYLEDSEIPVEAFGKFTWYDSREKHPTRSEHRFYYPAAVQHVFADSEVGDPVFVFQLLDDTFLLVTSPARSRTAELLTWLCTDNALETRFAVDEDLENSVDRNSMQLADLFERLGITPEVKEASLEQDVEQAFGDLSIWPSGKSISQFVWTYNPEIEARENPDEALSRWLDLEYRVFRIIEQSRIESSIDSLRSSDRMVEDFLRISLSVQNRRKSRAGKSLEYHFERILTDFSIPFSAQARTELKKTVDFLVPGTREYNDPSFPAEQLYVIACKTSLKDRWRQVLSEAARVPSPYLLTIDQNISSDQVTEIVDSSVQLVLPQTLIAPYEPSVQSKMRSVGELLSALPKRSHTRYA